MRRFVHTDRAPLACHKGEPPMVYYLVIAVLVLGAVWLVRHL